MEGFEDLVPAKQASNPFADLIPEQQTQERAAFGIYPKQRATPAKPETKEAMRQFAETSGELMGFKIRPDAEFEPEKVATAGGLGAALGLGGPTALKALGGGIGMIPTLPTKAVGAGLSGLGTALQAVPAAKRARAGAGTFAGMEAGGQAAEVAGLPPIVGEVAGAGLPEALGTGAKALGRKLIGTTQPEITDLARKFESLGFKLEPGQLRKDKPIPSPGFGEAEKLQNEKLATKLVSEQTGKATENITPTFVGERKKQLGEEYNKIFGRNLIIDTDLVRQLQEMQRFERAVNPAGVGPVSTTASNIIDRWQSELLKQQQQQIENRVKRIMQTQQRGGVEPIVRLRKDWPTIRNAQSGNVPAWYADVDKTIGELSDKLGLQVKPQLWVSAPRREGLYGMATGDGHIIINDGLDVKGAVATALHEFGHQAEFQMFIHAPYNEQAAVVKAFNDQMASIPIGKTTVEQYRPITADKYDPVTRARIPDPGNERGYLRNFSEWFAEMTSRFITQTKEPTNLVEKFFTKIADNWKKIYERVVGYVPLPAEVDRFFRSKWKGDLVEKAGAEAGALGKTAMEGEIPLENVTAKIDGRELQRLRSNLTRISRTASDGNDRRVAGEFVDAIDKAIGRQQPDLLARLEDTNRKYAAASVLGEGIEKGFVTQGKVSLQGLGNHLANNVYGFGSGTSAHPLYELAYGGRQLGIRSRVEGAQFPSYDAVAALLGRSRQALGSLVGSRTQTARDIQRALSEEELRKGP